MVNVRIGVPKLGCHNGSSYQIQVSNGGRAPSYAGLMGISTQEVSHVVIGDGLS